MESIFKLPFLQSPIRLKVYSDILPPNGWNGWKWLELLEIAGNFWKHLAMAGRAGNGLNGKKRLEWLDIAGRAGNGLNNWK